MQVSTGESTVDPQAPKPMATMRPGANPKTISEIASATEPATPAPSASAPAPQGSASTSSADTPELESGGRLMVEAYAAIWIIVLLLVVLMWRRTRSLEARVAVLDSAVSKIAPRVVAGGSARAKPKKAAVTDDDDEAASAG